VLRANRDPARRLRTHRGRLGGAFLLLAVCVMLAGCQALATETVIAPTAVREAVQSRLGDALSETRPVDSVATLTDVAAIYALRTPGEHLLLVVFNSREATVQLTGAARPSHPELVVVRNVVAVYDHDRGAVSRMAQLRAVLLGLDRAAA
jgi:hypothetical protein